jgi:hypothetical protein
MGIKSNKAIVSKFFIEVINNKNLHHIYVICSQNYLQVEDTNSDLNPWSIFCCTNHISIK